MLRWILRGAVWMLLAGAAGAAAPEEPPQPCDVPDSLVYGDAVLPNLARGMDAGQPLVIAILGTSSSAGAGVSDLDNAYPVRLERELTRRFPKANVAVHTIAQRGATAAKMERTLATQVLKLRPALVIWQTGAADAIQGVALDDFGAALERGIEALQGKGVDVMLMDMQYSPRTDAFINSRPYRGYLLWMAKRQEVLLFRRYDIMQYWSENEILDLGATQKATQLRNADRVHQCIAGLLADMIEAGIKDAREQKQSP